MCHYNVTLSFFYLNSLIGFLLQVIPQSSLAKSYSSQKPSCSEAKAGLNILGLTYYTFLLSN